MKEVKNNFEEYGFTADFKGEILKKMKYSHIGYISSKNSYLAIEWDNMGNAFYGNEKQPNHNLTPIKKEWYKDESNFPCLVFVKSDSEIKISWRYKNGAIYFDSSFTDIDNVRPATEEEVLKLLIKE